MKVVFWEGSLKTLFYESRVWSVRNTGKFIAVYNFAPWALLTVIMLSNVFMENDTLYYKKLYILLTILNLPAG